MLRLRRGVSAPGRTDQARTDPPVPRVPRPWSGAALAPGAPAVGGLPSVPRYRSVPMSLTGSASRRAGHERV